MTPDLLESQIETLRAERAKATEPVVQEALDAKIAALQEEQARLAQEVGDDEATEPTPTPARALTPAEQRDFDAGIGRLRLFVNREEWSSVQKEIASLRSEFGDHAELLEAQGDFLRQKRKLDAALESYAEALKLRPNDVGIERKHAEVVFTVGNLGSLDDQMRAGLGGGALVDADPMARAGVATFLSLLFPGVGQIVLGEQMKGIAMFLVWGAAMSYMAFHPDQFRGLLSQLGVARGGQEPGGLFWLSFAVALFSMVIAVFDCAAKSKSTPKRAVAHPKPPVDLPFE